MTATEQRILTLLECKQRLESEREEYVDEIHAWMAEALEALLRTQLELLRRPTGYSPPDEPWWDPTRPPDKP